MINFFIPNHIISALEKVVSFNELTEIRIRVDKPISYAIKGKYYQLADKSGKIFANREDIEYILMRVSNHSLYSINECLIDGYIPFSGGIRIGVTGEGVREKEKLISVKNINYLTIRLPHEIKSLPKNLKLNTNVLQNLLIVSKAGAGKTTLLREILRRYSNNGYNCMLIDERYEVSALHNGRATLDVGVNTDICSNVPKKQSIENTIRAMRPDIIFTDEIYRKEEIDSLIAAIRGGIKVVATMHGDDIELLKNNLQYSELLNLINNVIILSDKPAIGTIVYEGKICSA